MSCGLSTPAGSQSLCSLAFQPATRFFFRFSSLVTVHVGMVIVHVGINMYMYMYMYALCTATVARSYKGSENLVVTVQHLLLSSLHTVVALKIVTTCIKVYASKVMRSYGKNRYIPVGGA